MSDLTLRHRLQQLTAARIGLDSTGVSLTAEEVLRFSYAHAMARDAVHAQLDAEAICSGLKALGYPVARAQSQASDRQVYLRRPDLGRQLSSASREALQRLAEDQPSTQIAIVIGEGLSALAIERNILPMLSVLRSDLTAFRLAPVVLCAQTRVAIADEIGEIFKAQLAIMFIGERPGLSSPDSMGAYLTYAPHRGMQDSQRNCISNIRVGGLSLVEAREKIIWLARKAFEIEATGVRLKDESGPKPLALE